MFYPYTILSHIFPLSRALSTHRTFPLKYSHMINSCLMSVSLLDHKRTGGVSVLITDASLELGIVLPHSRQENGCK